MLTIMNALNGVRRIRKVGKLYGDNLDFKDIKFPVKVWDVHKIVLFLVK